MIRSSPCAQHRQNGSSDFHDEEDEQDDENEGAELAEVEPRSATGLRLWDASPLLQPRLDPDLCQLPAIARGVEVITYSIASFEFWLSPSGWLRAWIRLNLLLTIVLAVSSITVIPVINTVLIEVTGWTAMTDFMVGNITQAVRNLPPIGLAVGALLLLLQLLRAYRNRKRRHGYHHSDSYEDYQ